MVARKPNRDGQSGRPATAAMWLALWQRLLTQLFTAARRLTRSFIARASASFPRIAEYAREVRAVLLGEPNAQGVPRPRTVGILALGSGVLLSLLLGVATGSGPYATLNALIGALWVVARLLAMRAIAPTKRIELDAITNAWAAGAIPYALAVLPPLRLIAWLLGGYLTARALRKRGVSRADARLVTAWGYGVEVLGVIIVWIARNLVVAALFFG